MANTLYYLSGISLIVQYLTNLGVVAQGAQLYTYVGGTVNTKQTTYTDSTGTVPNANPLTLSGAGRPQTPSGAPTAFWVPAGVTINLQVSDAVGNLLVVLNNVGSMNDPTTVLSALAAATTGSGADLIANGVRSYDVFASMRAANVPSLVSGQTLIVIAEGGNAIGDGLGGEFYWSGSSTATDDNFSVIKPAGETGPGRYLRLVRTAYQKFKPANTAIASSTILTADPDLQIQLPVGNYKFELFLHDNGNTSAGGLKVGMAFSGGINPGVWGSVGGGTGAVNQTSLSIVAASPATTTLDNSQNGSEWHLITGMLGVSAAGSLQLLWAQLSSNATASIVGVGSFLNITPL